MRIRSASLFAFAVLAVQGQDMTSRLPLGGFVYDAGARSLRALSGIPGSAYAGPSVAAGLDVAWASGFGAAVGVREGATVVLTSLQTLQPKEHSVPGLLTAKRVAWSARGTVAALYDGGSVQRLTVSSQVSAGPAVPVGFLGDVTALAVDDSGAIAIAAGGSVHLLQDSAVKEVASGLEGLLAISFGKNQVLYAGHANGIAEIRTDGSSKAVRQIVEGRAVTALAADRKAGRLFGIDAAARRVLVIDSAGTLVGELTLDREPTTLEVLQPDSVLLLNGIEGQGLPAIVLDITKDPAVFFIQVGDGNPA